MLVICGRELPPTPATSRDTLPRQSSFLVHSVPNPQTKTQQNQASAAPISRLAGFTFHNLP